MPKVTHPERGNSRVRIGSDQLFLSHQSGPAPTMERKDRRSKRHCKGVENAWWHGVKARRNPQTLKAGAQVTRGGGAVGEAGGSHRWTGWP